MAVLIIFDNYWFVMRLFVLFLIFSGINLSVLGQVNDYTHWIKFDQSYLKIEISKDGIYRLGYSDLKDAGLTSFKNISLLHHGEPVKLLAHNEIAGELQKDGYIEFYAEKNHGVLDSLVYRPRKRNNPFNSLFSDLATYFITNADELPLRADTLISNATIATTAYYTESMLYAPNTQYSLNNSIGLLPVIQQSFYEPGEGWSGEFATTDTTKKIDFFLPDFVKSNSKTKVYLSLNGRSRLFHNLNLSLNTKIVRNRISIPPFGVYIDTLEDNSGLQNLSFEIKGNNKGAFDWYSVNYIQIKYPKSFGAALTSRPYELPLKDSLCIFKNPGQNASVYDISDPNNIRKVLIKDNSEYQYFKSNQDATIYISDAVQKPKIAGLVSFKKRSFKPEYLIISHKSLKESAEAWASYRSSKAGGEYKCGVVYIEDLYDQYFFGEKNPLVIRNAVEDILDGTSDRKNLLIIGKAVTFPDVLKSNQELVPSFGYPGSDALLTAGLFGEDADVEGVPTGRLNVSKNSEVLSYLKKVREFEESPSAEWKKRVLHMSGGENTFEMTLLKNLLVDFEKGVKTGPFSGEIEVLSKKQSGEIEEVDISAPINKGVGLVTFVGHGSPTIIDLNIGYSSDLKRNYSNKSKYPFMFFNGCGVGNIFYRYNTLSTDWLITPDKGAIGLFANSFWSYFNSTKEYLGLMYGNFFQNEKTANATIGQIHQAINKTLAAKKSDTYILADMHQVVYQGDPALRVFPVSKPDYLSDSLGIFLQSLNSYQPISKSDSFQVGAVLSNYGRFLPSEKINVALALTGDGLAQNIYKTSVSGFSRKDTVFFKVPFSEKIRKIEVKIDPENLLEEYNENNNSVNLTFPGQAVWADVSSKTLYPENFLEDVLSPFVEVKIDGKAIENGQLVSKNASLEVVLMDDRSLKSPDGLLKVYIKSCETCQYLPLDLQNFTVNRLSDNQLQFLLSDLQLKAGLYWVLVQGSDKEGNTVENPFEISFKVTDQTAKGSFSVFPNPSESDVTAKVMVHSPENPVSGMISVFEISGKHLFDMPFSPKVGPNYVFLPVKSLYGAGNYVLKSQVEFRNADMEILEYRLVIR